MVESDVVLDAGSGIGGPARYLADQEGRTALVLAVCTAM